MPDPKACLAAVAATRDAFGLIPGPPGSSPECPSALPAAPERAVLDRAVLDRALPEWVTPASNVLEVTVGELSGALKRTIEDRFGFVRVRGEISNYRGPHSSGHAYFCLKDETARIDAVVWRTAFSKLKVKPQEGLEVIATGRVTTFPGKSTYQIVVETIEPAGIGALMALLDERRKTLAAEGLFDAARKRAIPFLPRRIGVVTSPTGAVIRDILHRLLDRFPRDVLVWPVRVQGETAAAEVAAAIAGFDALPAYGPLARPDVLIVARGGGSLEDLWAFNEEVVVRAAAACSIPLIAAVGHETDTTLIDHVADLRAPTPSGAAEKAVPVRAELASSLTDIARRHRDAVARHLVRGQSDLRAVARALPSAETVTSALRQKLDRADERLTAATAAGLDRRHLELSRQTNRLSRQAPRTRLAQTAQRLGALEQRLVFAVERNAERRERQLAGDDQRLMSLRGALSREVTRGGLRIATAAAALDRAMTALLRTRRERLERYEQLLNTLGYRQVLARGFALVRDREGRPVRSASAAQTTTSILDIEFADGHMEVSTLSSPATRRNKPKPKVDQGSLF